MSDIVLLACGERPLAVAGRVRQRAKEEGFDVSIVNARFVKPLDEALLASLPQKYVVTLEDNVLAGGLGDAVARFLRGSGKEICSFGYRDAFIPHGAPEELAAEFGLKEEDVLACVRKLHARG